MDDFLFYFILFIYLGFFSNDQNRWFSESETMKKKNLSPMVP